MNQALPTFLSLFSAILFMSQSAGIRDSSQQFPFLFHFLALPLLLFLLGFPSVPNIMCLSGLRTFIFSFCADISIPLIVIFKSIILSSIFQKFKVLGSFTPVQHSIICYCLCHTNSSRVNFWKWIQIVSHQQLLLISFKYIFTL